MNLSVRIVAHERRRKWAEQLSRELDAPVVWDQTNNAWDTHRRALLSAEGSHVLVIQDDAILSEGVRESVERMIEFSGEHPVSLFAQSNPRVKAIARLEPEVWWAGGGPNFGVAVVLPTNHVEGIVRYGDVTKNRSYDQRLWKYFQAKKLSCYYTWPSLVDHRLGPSLMWTSKHDRPAHNFGSGLELDWSVPPMETNPFPTLLMVKDGRRVKVRYGSAAYRTRLRQGFTEEAPG